MDNVAVDRVLTHYGEHLGEPDGRWHGAGGSLHVVRYSDQPIVGATTYLSLGLSAHKLAQTGGSIRQELLISCYAKQDPNRFESLLACLAGQIALAGRAFAEASTWPNELTIWASKFAAFFAAPPKYFVSLPAIVPTEPPTVLVWLVPLFRDESDLVAAEGWDALEGLFVAKDPDLLDLKRKSVLAGGH